MTRSRLHVERLQAEMRARLDGQLARKLAADKKLARELAAKPRKEKPRKAAKPVRKSKKRREAERLDHRMWDYLRRQGIAVEARRAARCSSPQSALAIDGAYGAYLSVAEWAEIGQKASAYLDSRSTTSA